jgi:3-hydroxybutyryl-CoA dehydrogenase
MPDGLRGTIGVLGSGTMGGGIAQAAAMAGFDVIVQDVSTEILDRFRARLDEHLAQRVSRGRVSRQDADAALARLRPVTALDDLCDAGAIIEAAPEDLALKRQLFQRLDALTPPAVVLASNTSSLSITALAGATRHPERVVGMHFFNPVPVMPLVEIISGARTSAEVVQSAVGLARALGKTPIEVADAPGFLVNRVARPFYAEAMRLLAAGMAPVAVIDRIVREAGGYRMGPFELLDLIGLDVSLAVTRSISEGFFHDSR